VVNTSDNDPSFEERAKAAFDASVESLDGRTRSALTQARHAALAQAATSKRVGWQVWGPLSGIAAAAFVLVVMFTPALQRLQHPEGGTPFDDLDIIADAENFEMLEDLDFYVWLDSSVAALPTDG
jgi:hypothetical protein